MSQPSLSHVPLKRWCAELSPHVMPWHRWRDVPGLAVDELASRQPCTVICVLILFASQMSSSAQHVPKWPVPAFMSVFDGTQPIMFASPLIHLRSCGHCASQ